MREKDVTRLKNLKASTAAAGVTMALAQAANGAELDTNLVVNGDFENVDPLVSVSYDNAEISEGWTTSDGTSVFAYNYAQNYDDRNDLGEVPPGNEATSSTDYYFSMNGSDVAGVQNIDLSSGASAALIASGNAEFDLAAYFTNYASDVEQGRLILEFYDGDPGVTGLDASLIGEQISFLDPNIDEWTLIGGTGAIPAATKWARLLLDQEPTLGSSGGPDVYVDNVSFMVTSGGSLGPEITSISRSESGTVTLVWNSLPESLYGVEFSQDLIEWQETTEGGVASEGLETRTAIDSGDLSGDRLFFRVFEIE